MSHLLPPHGHPAREMFEVADLVAVATGERPVPCARWQLRRSAAQTFASSDAVRRVVFLYVDPTNDQLQLVSLGRRGGFQRHWTFGPITRATRLL